MQPLAASAANSGNRDRIRRLTGWSGRLHGNQARL